MIKILYTNSAKFEGLQPDASKSLGGYISSSEVQNALLGNLFGEISKYTINLQKPEVRIIAIKNDAIAKTGLKAFFTYPGVDPAFTNQADFSIAYSAATADACGDLMAPQKLSSIYGSPYSITFQSATGEPSALNIGNFDANQYIILYIKRVIKSSLLTAPTDQQLKDILNGVTVVDKVEDISLTLAWD